MREKNESPNRKGELIQLRVEKAFLDQLNALASNKLLPLSVMLRLWLSDRLKEELSMIGSLRSKWEIERLGEIEKLKDENFRESPLLVIHVHPLTPGIAIDLSEVARFGNQLIPWGTTGKSGRIKQSGYELIRQHNGIVHARGQIFKSGQIEGVFSIESNNNEILGMQIDDAIVTVIEAYCHLLKTQETPLPYLFKIFLLNAKGFSLSVHPTIYSSQEPDTFESNKIELSDILIAETSQFSSDEAIGNHIVSQLDELWNSAGEPGSASYDENQKWRKRR